MTVKSKMITFACGAKNPVAMIVWNVFSVGDTHTVVAQYCCETL